MNRNKSNYGQELLSWEKNIIALREKYRNTPPGFQTETEAEMVREKWHKEYENYRESCAHRLMDSISFDEAKIFVGRTDILFQMKKILIKEGCVLLYGMGGSGKSALAIKYAHENADKYDHIIFMCVSDKIINAFCDDWSVRITNISFNRKVHKTIRTYFNEKLMLFNQICNEQKILMIIDNQNIPDDTYLKDILNLGCDKIITSRVDYEMIPDTQKLKIEGLTKEEQKLLIKAYSNNKISQISFEKLLDFGTAICGHALSLKLATVSVIENDNNKEAVDLVDIVDSFKLRKKEKEILLYLSIMPTQGIEKELFFNIIGDNEKLLHRLIEISLVETRFNEAKKLIVYLHPLVSLAVRKLYAPNYQNCSRLLRGFEGYMNGTTNQLTTWDRSYEENRMLEPYIMNLYKEFCEPKAWLATAFEEIATFLWIQGYFEEAEEYALKIFDSVYEYYGNTNEMPGRQALRVAAVYYNHLDLDKASYWYNKGYELLKNVEKDNVVVAIQLLLACGKLMRIMLQQKDKENYRRYSVEFDLIAKRWLNNKDLTIENKKRIELEYAYYLQKEVAYYLLEDDIYSATIKYKEIEKWIRANENLGYRIVGFEQSRIELLLRKGDYESALNIARENVEKTILYRGKTYKDYIKNKEIYADILVRSKYMEEAFSNYEEILILLQHSYSYDTMYIARITDKMHSIRSFL